MILGIYSFKKFNIYLGYLSYFKVSLIQKVEVLLRGMQKLIRTYVRTHIRRNVWHLNVRTCILGCSGAACEVILDSDVRARSASTA